VPYWRSCLDSASGIDIYGQNGIAVADIDNDGSDEIYVCQPGGLPNRLYKNTRETGIIDITDQAGVGLLDDSSCALFVDFRNCGLQDLVVLTNDSPLLFLNRGNGTFTFKPYAFRFASKPQGTFSGMAAADYNRDGLVDLYLCCYVYFQSEDQYRYPMPFHDAKNGPPNFMFRNELKPDGEGVFVDVTEEAGLNENNNRYSFAPAWCDYNGDGWPDLYVANDFGRKNLYKNDRGHFQDVAAEAGVEDIGPGMSASWFDYDGDGRPDLYVSNMWTSAGQRVVESGNFMPGADPQLREAYRRHAKGNSLYRNLGNGMFEETGVAEGVEMGRWAWSSDGLDFDNDGTPEILVTTGMLTNSLKTDLESFFWRHVVSKSPKEKTIAPEYEQGWDALNELVREGFNQNAHEPNVFYVRKEGQFYDLSGVSGLDYADDSRAFAALDFDGDGNLDLILKSRLGPQIRVFRNECGTGRKVLAIHLRGTRSNRDAIGAAVEVKCGEFRNWQFVRAGSGYISQHTKTLYFGLQDNLTAEIVQITWPSGFFQEVRNLEAGFTHFIEEGSSEITKRPFLSRRDNQMSSVVVVGDNQPISQSVWLLEPVPLPERRKGPGFLCLINDSDLEAPEDVPFEFLNLAKESADLAASYALFRKYIIDYRSDFVLPLVILIDERGMAHKIYPSIPSASILQSDLNRIKDSNRIGLALPFGGRFYTKPARNFFRMGAALLWAGYPEQAVTYLDEVVRRSPDNFLAQLSLGQIHLGAGRVEAARDHLARAVILNPASSAAWNDLGGVEMRQGNYSAALKNLEKALSIAPGDYSALINGGIAYEKIGRFEDAETMFRRAIALEPNDTDAARQLGTLLSNRGRLDEARKYLQQAISVDRDDVFAINNLGVVYMQMKKFDDAIAAFRFGLQTAPDNETLCFNLARAYARTGDRLRAREILLQLLERKDNPAARELLQEIGGS
jgi:tetratricopeptide (TPR) repeat protein